MKVVLPELIFDPDRVNPAKPAQYMDNTSLYLGGNANGQETDIGMIWEVIRDENGNVTPDRRCWRPFWRHLAPGEQNQTWGNPDAQNTDYHFYPGDTISLSLKLIGNELLLFEVQGMGRIKHKQLTREIPCKGYTLLANTEYKRVIAIDQMGREGKPVEETKAKLIGGEFLETNLLRLDGTDIITVPMHAGRLADMRCPEVKHFVITASEEDKKIGAEKVNIIGTPE
jgi:hypothetical protein